MIRCVLSLVALATDPAANKIEWMLGIGQDGTHMMVLAKDQQTIEIANRFAMGPNSGPGCINWASLR